MSVRGMNKEMSDEALRFGQIALKKGFITSEHLKKALTEQINSFTPGTSGNSRRIGEILFEKGWIRNKHIALVLKEQLKKGPDEKKREQYSPEKKNEIARAAGIILPGMTKKEVRETYHSLQPRIWYTPKEQEVWYFSSPQKQNIYFIEDKVEKIKYIL